MSIYLCNSYTYTITLRIKKYDRVSPTRWFFIYYTQRVKHVTSFYITISYCRDAPQFNGSSSNSSPIPMTNNHQLNQQQHVTARPIGNGLYGYERSAQSPVNNFCRFPPLLVDSPSPCDWDESHDSVALDQQVRPMFSA